MRFYGAMASTRLAASFRVALRTMTRVPPISAVNKRKKAQVILIWTYSFWRFGGMGAASA